MSTYTCPHCGQHDLSTQRRHNCPKPPSLSIPLGPPRSMDPCANEYIARLTRELEEARRERSAAKAEAMTAQASLRRVERELEAARERERHIEGQIVALVEAEVISEGKAREILGIGVEEWREIEDSRALATDTEGGA